MVSTYQTPYRVSPVAMLVLCVTLVQGTSTSLTLAYHFNNTSSLLEPIVNVVWALTYVMALVGLVVNFGVNWISWLIRYRLLLTLLLAGAALSALWSVDTALSTERTIHLVGSTLIALYLGFMVPLTRLLVTAAVVLAGLLIASVLVAVGYPALGIEQYEGREVWRGVMTSKNTLGFWAAIATLLFANVLGMVQSSWRKSLCVAALVLALLVLAKSVSATSVLALLLGALIMIYFFVAFRFKLGLIAMLVLGLLFTALAGLAFNHIDTAELIGRSGDMTGRGEVWSQTWQLILQRPLTGYGYGTLWYPTPESLWIQQSLTNFTWKVFHAHNGLLQLASEIGLPLTVLAILMVVQQLVEIIYCQYQRQQPGVLFILGFTVALLASNYSEARLLVSRELYWIFFIALPISMLQQVTVTAQQPGVIPTPAPLSNRTRSKLANMVSARLQRQALKLRLRSRRDQIIDMPASDANTSNHDKGDAGTELVSLRNHQHKLARRQKKQAP